MNRMYWAVVFSAFMLGCQFLMQAANGADTVQDGKCITLINPVQCSSIGSSVCQALGKTCSNVNCFSCDSTTDLPTTVCVQWEGATCTPTGTPINCGGNNNETLGNCKNVGACICNNPQSVGLCSEWGSWTSGCSS
jgi:hypothetical protein